MLVFTIILYYTSSRTLDKILHMIAYILTNDKNVYAK